MSDLIIRKVSEPGGEPSTHERTSAAVLRSDVLCAITWSSLEMVHGETSREMLVEMFEGIEQKTDANESIKLFTSLLRDGDSGWLMAMH